ncbi:CbiX/SirB N-terminal domain-containing protein [Arthrobacter sp. AQ5-05]|uniref:sirohydrochlorin chelatase n=1 Tax=Arthrobacter sp. AQ5-05 TaxID=2184581 RepID=UPI0025707748|nr:CbiX/SirB N-terminal domain-containing protein [Arthrobacter sp. AQ5-05]
MSIDAAPCNGTHLAPRIEHSAWLGWMEADPHPDLVAVSHGTNSPTGSAAVLSLVEEVARALDGITVHGAFVDVQQPRVEDLIASPTINPGNRATLIPLLLSAGTHASKDLGAAAALRAGTTVAAPLGPEASLAAVMHRRLLQAGWVPGEAVIMACAGTTDPVGVTDCRTMAQLLAGRLQVPVTVAYISVEEPRLEDALAYARSHNPGRRTVVASYLLAPGYFAQLAAKCAADVLSAPLLDSMKRPPKELVDIVVNRFHQSIKR